MYFNVIAGLEKKITSPENPIIDNFYNDFQKYIFRHNDAVFSFRLNDEKLQNIFDNEKKLLQVITAMKNGRTEDMVRVFKDTELTDYSFIAVYVTEVALREKIPVALLRQHLEYLMLFTNDRPEEKPRLLLLFLIKHAYALKDGSAVVELAEEIFLQLDEYASEEQNHVIVFYYMYHKQKSSPEVMAVIEHYLQKEFALGRNIETMGGVIFLTLVLTEYYCEKHCYNKAEELLIELENTIFAINNTADSFKEAYHLKELGEYNTRQFAAFYNAMTKENRRHLDHKKGDNSQIYESLIARLSIKKLYDSYYAAKNTNNIDFFGNWLELILKKEIINIFNNKEQQRRVGELMAKMDKQNMESIYYEYANSHTSPLNLKAGTKEVDLSFLVSLIGLEAWNKMELFAQANICRYLTNYIVFRREFIASLNNNEHAVFLVNNLQKNKLFINQKNDFLKVLAEKICHEFLWHEDNFYSLVSFYAALDKNNKKTIIDTLQNYPERNIQILLYKLLLGGDFAENVIVDQEKFLINEHGVSAGFLALLNYKLREHTIKQLVDIKNFLIKEFVSLPVSFKKIITKKRQNTDIENYRQELLKEITSKIEKVSLQHDIMLRRVQEQKTDYEIFSEYVAGSEEQGVVSNSELDGEIEQELDLLEYVSLAKMPLSGEMLITPEVFGANHPASRLLKEIKHKIEKDLQGDLLINLSIVGDELSFEAVFNVAANEFKIVNSPVAYDKTMDYLKFWLAKIWNNCYGLGALVPENREQRVAEIINSLVYPEKTRELMQYVYSFNQQRISYPFRFSAESENYFTVFHRLVATENSGLRGRRTELLVLEPLAGIEAKEQIADLSNIYQLGFVHRRPWRITNGIASERAVDNYIHFERLIKEKGFNLNVADDTEYYKIELSENLRRDPHLLLEREKERWKFTPTGWRGYLNDGRKIGGSEFERTYVMPHFRIYKVNER